MTNFDKPAELASLVRLIADRASDSSIHKTKICVFLGAGADISSGGVSFAELKRQALEDFAKRQLFDVTQPEAIDDQFNDLFHRLEPDDRALLVEAIFRKMQHLAPSDAYKLLVLLTEAGGVDAVVTTNFDLMLERAQSELGRDLFQVFAPGVARPYLISNERFELPKKPYLKLHGDIASRSVILLTASDLENATYDSSMLELLNSILRTHDIVIVGYSGSDKVLGQIIAKGIEGTSNRIFWCNPHAPTLDSSPYAAVANRIRVITTGFDQLMMEVARPVLERPSLAVTEPTYLRCLFDWRLDYTNREYLNAYGVRSGKSVVQVFARRRLIEERLTSFLRADRPLAVVAGPSGYGKTTVGIRLHRTWSNDSSNRILLIRSRSLTDNADLEQHISEQLGGLGLRTPFSLFQLEKWLKESGLRLVLFVDGVNEFSPILERCVQFFRNILRFCYFLPEKDSALRVIATIRQETWNAMLPHLDVPQLSKTLWSEGNSEQSFGAIACGAFTDEELGDALARLREYGATSIDTNRLTPTVTNQLRDPYLLSMVAEAVQQGLPSIPGAGIYHRAFEAKLRQRGSFIDTATLNDVLASLAIASLGSRQERFREIDIQPAALRGEIVRVMKDLHVFVETGDGFLQFDHDRTLEYFLAVGLASSADPSLETLEDLRQYLRRFRTESKPIAAARLYFQLAPSERFPLVAKALRLLDDTSSDYDLSDRELLFGFARDVTVEMAEQQEPLIGHYLDDAVAAARVGKIGSHQLRTVVQAAATLPAAQSIPLLTKVGHPTSSLPRTEANIYATDKLVKQYLLEGCPSINFLHEEPYATFFADESLNGWQQVGRLLGFIGQVGPDNTHPDEYSSVVRVIDAAFDELSDRQPMGAVAAKAFTGYFLENCDRLLFNATPPGINRFFNNPGRARFSVIVDRLAAGAVLTEEDLVQIEPYTQQLSSDVEYHLSHALFALSSFNDVQATLRLAEARLALFSNDTSPEEVDFFHAVLVYLHVLHNLPYEEARFRWWEERILKDWPQVLLYRPGLQRGERRGFKDPFDRVFEDGFGVIYPYGVLLPSLRRRAVRYPEYRRQMGSQTNSLLPLYSQYLDQFLRAERIEEAIQVLQAFAGVIVPWPMEGLLGLRAAIGHAEPQVRRASVRILAESYNRHPDETIQFLKTSGAAVTDEDLVEIKIRQDAHIGRRQVGEEEWARIGHFLLRRPRARETFVDCVRILLRAPSLEAAVAGILQSIGTKESAGR